MNKLKNLTGFIISLLILTSNYNTLISQSEFAVGHIEWQITDLKFKDELPGGDMLKNSTYSLFYIDGKELMVMDMMGGFSITKVLYDRENARIKSYLNSMGDKLMLKMEVPDAPQADINIEVDEADRREILGFDAFKTKMSIQMEGRPLLKIDAYVTEKVRPRSSFLQPVHNNPFDGMPLQLTIVDQNMEITFEAVLFNEEFDESVFDIDESGYQAMDLEQIQQMGLSGEMGF
ncbi:MAG: hypothetical protein EA411_06180 [Saprospirales bacterium]|nr:MAG: hypothetical protein EA411_06180 [Saprospirales bacterium]